MLKSKDIFILGYSGHAYVVLDVALANNYQIKGYFDLKAAVHNPYNIHFMGNEEKCDLTNIVKNHLIFPAVGSNIIREKLYSLIESHQLKQTILVDNSASVSSMAKVGSSTLVAPNAVINSMAIIGKACIINTSAIIEHECKIGDFTHIAPGAVLAGNVTIGKRTFIGANAVVKQGITIGNNVVVGSGAVVIKNISDDETWVGNPARKIK